MVNVGDTNKITGYFKKLKMRGRKPVPKEVAKSRGYYRPGRHKDEVSMNGIDFVYGETPEPPEELNQYAKEIWIYQLNEAAKVFGYISKLDLPLFEMYCKVYGELMEMRDLCNSETYFYKDHNGTQRVNPLYKERDNLKKLFIKLSAEFGFSPSARTKITLQNLPTETEEEDEFQL